jgi:hypothetical protein
MGRSGAVGGSKAIRANETRLPAQNSLYIAGYSGNARYMAGMLNGARANEDDEPIVASPLSRQMEIANKIIGVLASVFLQRGWRAAFKRGDAGGAQRFGRQEPHAALTAIAGFLDALALDGVEEGLLFLSVDVPKAKIVVVDSGHLSVSFTAGGQSRPE